MGYLSQSSALRRFLFSGALLGALVALLQWPAVVQAENWPAWRNDGSGISPEKGLSVEWDPNTNILWKLALPGEGNSSPIIWDGRIFLTSAMDGGKKRLVLCYDASGAETWRREFAVVTPAKTYPKNGYASHTPVTDGQRVFAFFDEPGLVALNARTGEVDWQLELGPFKTMGYLSASPILAGDSIIMVCDVNESTYEGKKQTGGFIVAVDKATGRERWRTPRKPSAHAASPLAIQVAGKTQIVVSGDPIISYDAPTGAEVWSCTGMKPMCAPSPVFDGTLVWVASGRNGPALSIDPTGSGDVSETHATMVTDVGGPYVPSLLVYPCLMLPGDDGQISFFDKSGQPLLQTRIPGHFTASPIGADSRVYWPDEKGRTYVLDVNQLTAGTPRAPIIAVNDLNSEPILASPAISNGRLYLRSTSNLYCISGLARTKPTLAASTTHPQANLAQLEERYQKASAKEGPDIAVRLDVVDSLAALHDPEAVGLLLQIVQKDSHWDVSEAAAKALAGRDVEATAALLQMLDDKREYPRIIAADALGQMKAVQSAGKLAALAGDKNRFVRLAALRALGRIGLNQQADMEIILPALTRGLSDDVEGPAKIAAIQALAQLSEKVGTHRAEVVKGLQVCAAGKNIQVAKAARETLVNEYKLTPDPTSNPLGPPPGQ